MSHVPAALLVVTGLVLGGEPVVALGDDLPADRVAALARVVQKGSDVASRGGLSRTDIEAWDECLKSCDARDFGHIRSLAEYGSLKEAARLTVDRGLRAVEILRSLRGYVKSASELGLLLSSTAQDELASAFLLFSSGPKDAGYERAVGFLASDARPELRLGAGILAEVGWLFGSRSQAYCAVAQNLLVDRDPNVAAKFGLGHVGSFRDRLLLDRVVGRFGDGRFVSTEVVPFLSLGSGAVGECLARGFVEDPIRRGAWYRDGMEGVRQVSRKKWKPSDCKKWWDQEREGWSASPTQFAWTTLFDGVMELAIGETRQLGTTTPGEKVSIRMDEFKAEARNGCPRVSFSLSVFGAAGEKGVPSSVFEAPDHELGRVAMTVSSWLSMESVAIPSENGKAQFRLWVWVKDDK